MKLKIEKKENCDVQVGIRMTKREKEKLDSLCKKYGKSQGIIIRSALASVR